jgi:ribose-phosphate pyrophosphokinase
MNYDLICVLENQSSEELFGSDPVKETLGDKIKFIKPIRYGNSETNVEVLLPYAGIKKILLASLVDDEHINDFIMNIMFAVDAIKRQGVEVDLFIPCLPYARQDRRNGRSVSITSKVMLDMFGQAGIGKLYVVDLHSTQMEGFAKFPIVNIDSMPILIETVKNKMRNLEGENFIIVSPDAGGVKRAKKYADSLGLPIAIIHKSRDPHTNESHSFSVVGNVENHHCIVVDDMVDTGGTLVDAEKMLKDQGAKTVTFAIGHPVLSDPKKGLDELDIVTLNTCVQYHTQKMTVKTIEEYFLRNILGIKLF